MKRSIIFSFLLIICYSLHAQWEWQNPLPTGNTFTELQFVSELRGWAVGYFGNIAFTNDGGINWELQESGTNNHLNALCFLDEDNGWIVGDCGTILTTTNGGQTWINQSMPSYLDYDFTGIDFANDSSAWIIGDSDIVLHTEDGGNTWEEQNLGASGYLNSVCAISINEAWVTGAYNVYHTTDTGITWEEINLGGNIDMWTDVSFSDSLHGWIVGFYYQYLIMYYTIIMSTNNGGITWQQQYSSWGNCYTSIDFIDQEHGWVSGDYIPNTDILKTLNGGNNWGYINTQYAHKRDINFFDQENGWIVGYHGLILNSSDGGYSWNKQTFSVSNDDISGVSFIDNYTGWAITDDGDLLHTTNGGAEWHFDNSLNHGSMNDIVFMDQTNGWAVGDRIIHTNDAGKTWEVQYENNNCIFNSVYFLDLLNGWAVGYEDMVLYTPDGGKTWIQQFLSLTGYLSPQDVFFVDNEHGWIVSAAGIIYNTSDGGNLWNIQAEQLDDLYAVYFTDLQFGWAVGRQIYHTENGGLDWYLQTNPINGSRGFDVYFFDRYNGWIAGYLECLLSTEDGGANWQPHSFTYNYLSEMCFIDPDNGWIVGDNGTIMHTSAGQVRIENESSEDPGEELLIYPNPATSRISFNKVIDGSEIKIYDLNGNLLLDIVCYSNSPVINVSHLPEGLYIYKVITPDNKTYSGKFIKSE